MERNISVESRIGRSVRRAVQRTAYRVGVIPLSVRLRNGSGAVVLMYHSILDAANAGNVDPDNQADKDAFLNQMEFLRSRRRVVGLCDLITMVREGSPLDARTVAITFDDGYLDNLAVAAPILARYGFPATLFLPSGYIDRGESQWIDQVYIAFSYRATPILEWGTGIRERYDLQNDRDRSRAYRAVCADLMSVTGFARAERLQELRERLKPSERTLRSTMTWDDVRTLVKRYPNIEIGGHTAEHTDLTSVTLAEAKEEMKACADRIEQELGTRPRYFSFCYGRTSEALRRAAAEVGYEAACGGEGIDPVITAPCDVFRLPRVAAPPTMKRFALLTDSANTGFWRRLGR